MSMIELHALLPVLILVLGSTLVLMLGIFRPAPVRMFQLGIILAAGAAVVTVFVDPQVDQVAGMFSVGLLPRFFTVLWSIATILTLCFSWRYAEDPAFAAGEYVSLILFAAAGMALLSGATSFVGLFVGLETFTLVFYILVAFHHDHLPGMEAGLKYLVLGAIATGFLALGISLIYAAGGSFGFAEAFAVMAAGGGQSVLGILGLAILLIALGFKISLVPFHLWTPDVYQGAPAPVSGFLAAGSKGATLAAMIPLMLAAGEQIDTLRILLSAMAIASMLVGSVAALRQNSMKRMLAYSSVVHMGYVLIGFIVPGGLGQKAVIFYVVIYSLLNLGAFGLLGSLGKVADEVDGHDRLRGLAGTAPKRALALAVILFALAGIPPLGGFIAKFLIFKAAIAGGEVLLAVAGVLASLVSVYYYLRPIMLMYMEKGDPAHDAGSLPEHLALLFCLAGAVFLGIFPGSFLDFLSRLIG